MDAREQELDACEADGWRTHFRRSALTLIIALAPTGRPLAVAGAVIDDSICLLLFAVASDHDARWMLHDHLVQILIERRVSYLVVERGGPFGALGFPLPCSTTSICLARAPASGGRAQSRDPPALGPTGPSWPPSPRC
jgi:hypothetical protein